jgi:hypothetical protein
MQGGYIVKVHRDAPGRPYMIVENIVNYPRPGEQGAKQLKSLAEYSLLNFNYHPSILRSIGHLRNGTVILAFVIDLGTEIHDNSSILDKSNF